MKVIAKLSVPAEEVEAAKISAMKKKKHRAVFKRMDLSSSQKMEVQPAFLAPTSAEISEARKNRDLLAPQAKKLFLEHKRRCSNSPPERFIKTQPCQKVFFEGKWHHEGKCFRGRNCNYAHSKAELEAFNLRRICHYDGGKGLCTKEGCRHRHTVFAAGRCECGLTDLVVDVRKYKRRGVLGSNVLTAKILCTCPRRPQSLVECPPCGQTKIALLAPEARKRSPPRASKKRSSTPPGSQGGWTTQGRRRRSGRGRR